MSDEELEQIKGRWFSDTPHRPEYWADHAGRDVPRLIAQAERYRKALEQIADDGVEGYESPQKRVALAALGQEGEPK